MKWEKRILGSLCNVGRGSSPRPIANPAYYDGGKIPWVKIADATNSTKYIYRTKEFVNEYGASFSRKLDVGTLILAASGTLGFPMFMGVEGCIHDGWMYFDDYNGIDKEFLYYKLRTLLDYFNRRSYGAAIQNINTGILKELEIEIPTLNIQQKIASILSAYDDLIDNNLKRIKLLEEAAYQEYKIISSDKYSSKFIKYKLEDILLPIKRKPKISTSNYLEKGSFPIIDQSTSYINGYTEKKEAVYIEPLPIIVFGDHTRILKYVSFPFACGADGTQLIHPNKPIISVAYLYFELIDLNLSNYHYARHFKFLKEQDIYLPNDNVLLEYKKKTDPYFDLINVLRVTNSRLQEARDILLPRLMSGEIEV